MPAVQQRIGSLRTRGRLARKLQAAQPRRKLLHQQLQRDLVVPAKARG